MRFFRIILVQLLLIMLGELTSSLRIRSIQRAHRTHFALRAGNDNSFEVASAALLKACDERWRTLLSRQPKDTDADAVADLKIIQSIESMADSFPNEHTCPTANWAISTPAKASSSSSNTTNPIDGTWRLRFSTNPENIRRARKYHEGANMYEFADSRMGTFASVVSFNETQNRFRRELRKVKCLAPLSATSMWQSLHRIEVLFRSPVALPRLTIPILPQLTPFKRANVLEILYLNDDFLLTREDENYFSVRTRLYQAWDPGSPTGWIYVSGV